MKATSLSRLSPFCVPTRGCPPGPRRARSRCRRTGRLLRPARRSSRCACEAALPEGFHPEVVVAVLPMADAVSTGKPFPRVDSVVAPFLMRVSPLRVPIQTRPLGPRRSRARSRGQCALFRRVANDVRSRKSQGTPSGRANPDVPVSVLVDGGDGGSGRGRLFVWHAPSVPEVPDPSSTRADPEAVVRSPVERVDVLQRSVGSLELRLEGAITPRSSRETLPRRYRSKAVAAGARRGDARVLEAGRVRRSRTR